MFEIESLRSAMFKTGVALLDAINREELLNSRWASTLEEVRAARREVDRLATEYTLAIDAYRESMSDVIHRQYSLAAR